ncbi:ABC transporter ATP-binding protein [Candidatus Dojkabacteria bacterium]|jgi:ABC-2 type transport system ATP-binding protein|uniref:ABC transporter ATP-binding protein n=1 Tax=Candidatus Dojkabacteria bacterium TaxID=2099670 RepID=A0A955I6P9_9BACT|nr:ABC transporter ATP-binding protein [Candidatus Dojkabacteria bacterium]
MDKPIIKVDNVSKVFEIPHESRNTLKSYFLHPFKRIGKERFYALKSVDFEINQGDFVGVIGRNGSGKSTLLKILAGIFEPTKGKVHVNGTLVPFLELGVGFNPELTGRENIYLNGIILGMTRKYVESKFDEIVDFAEIRDFIDLQVKNYSSGMVIRLAFAIAVEARADIYLLDEVLSVGDAGFQKKSLEKMLSLLSNGATGILVSHNINDVKKYCNRVILLKKGEVVFDGPTDEGIKIFESQMGLMSEE